MPDTEATRIAAAADRIGLGPAPKPAGELATHIGRAPPGRRAQPATRPAERAAQAFTANAPGTGGALTLALGAGLAWWGLRHGGLLGTAGLFIGGWAVAQVWSEVTDG